MSHIVAVLGPPLYIGSIAAFYWTTTVVLVFCSDLQWWDIEPLQSICFSGVNLDIALLQNPAAINISFCIDTIVVV